jgi:DNA invertase Pin-like site-specific DNA recombinase
MFEDDGITGAISDERRPGLQKMAEAAKSKAFTKLVLVEQSRLAREHVDAQVILRSPRRLGCAGLHRD